MQMVLVLQYIASFNQGDQHLQDPRNATKRAQTQEDQHEHIICRRDKLQEMVSIGVIAEQHQHRECEPGLEVKSVRHLGLPSVITFGCKCGKCVEYKVDSDASIPHKGSGGEQYQLNARIGASMVEAAIGGRRFQDFQDLNIVAAASTTQEDHQEVRAGILSGS